VRRDWLNVGRRCVALLVQSRTLTSIYTETAKLFMFVHHDAFEEVMPGRRSAQSAAGQSLRCPKGSCNAGKMMRWREWNRTTEHTTAETDVSAPCPAAPGRACLKTVENFCQVCFAVSSDTGLLSLWRPGKAGGRFKNEKGPNL
jgi:hypothetical protein